MRSQAETSPRRMVRLALLTGLSLIIFVLESCIPNPVPIPGIKLGLANIITVYAVYRYRTREAFLVLISRVLLSAFICGQFSALIYSLSGGILCLIGMAVFLRFLKERQIWLCSIFGAFLHNTGQILAAILITRTPALIAYLPFLLVAGGIAGLFTGLCAQYLILRKDL